MAKKIWESEKNNSGFFGFFLKLSNRHGLNGGGGGGGGVFGLLQRLLQ